MTALIKRIVPAGLLLFVFISDAEGKERFETGSHSSAAAADTVKKNFRYINTNFENASQLDWAIDSAGVVNISLNYDHERSSPNRANGHWHFQVEADAGSDVTLTLNNFDNIWNGMKASPVSDRTNCLVSSDGITWTAVATDFLPNNSLKFTLHMETGKMYVASVEPYRISDLEKLMNEVRSDPRVEITTVGKTAEGRNLEIIRVGRADAPYRIFIRGRAHSWEPGGNWVIQGLIRSLLKKDASPFLDRYAVYIMPMANKDGVARGRTRFNTLGKDLNREWHQPADRELTPEKYAFESWLTKMIAEGKKPHLAIDLHNDSGGNVHVNLPTENNKAHTARVKRFVDLLYKHTWFTEGPSHVKNPGSFGEGLGVRFGIDAFVYELNYEWIAGLKKQPFGKDWERLGEQLRTVFYHYFDGTNRDN